jgi:thiol-disulfide isomerase/thioredoxin
MKKWLVLFVVLLCFHSLRAQQSAPVPSLQPAYLRFPTVPPFKLLEVDSATWLTKDDIKKNHETLIVFFSPDCPHCKHQTEDILAAKNKFNDIEIVMATYQPFGEMKAFYAYYRIGDHPNIKMGRDEKYTLPPFYKMTNLPYLALYDKKGNLITTFEGNQTVGTILDAFGSKAKD